MKKLTLALVALALFAGLMHEALAEEYAGFIPRRLKMSIVAGDAAGAANSLILPGAAVGDEFISVIEVVGTGSMATWSVITDSIETAISEAGSLNTVSPNTYATTGDSLLVFWYDVDG